MKLDNKSNELLGKSIQARKKKIDEKKIARNEKGWQAEKSAMTRTAIMEAAIDCLIKLGYANTTTALMADYAGVSRGAMMHHFPSRLAVISAVIDHLHALRLAEYSELMANIDDPNRKLTKSRIQASVKAAWEYVNKPSFIAYQELLLAARTDVELYEILAPVEADFESQFFNTVKEVFPHWERLSFLEGAHDMVQFLMKGMSLSHLSVNRNARARRVMKLLADYLYNLYSAVDLIDES